VAIEQRLRNLTTSLMGPMARQAAFSLAIKIFSIGCGFLFAVVAARLLGARDYGVIAVALAATAVVSALAPLGANGLAVREVARLTAQRRWLDLRRFFRWSGWLVTTVSVLLGSTLFLVARWTGPYEVALSYAAVLVPLSAVLLLGRGLIQGSGNTVAAQLPGDGIRWLTALIALAIVASASTNASPADVIFAYAAGCAVALGVTIFIAGRLMAGLEHGDSAPSKIEPWLGRSVPFLGITAIGIFGTETNTLLLGALSGPQEAGLYQPIAKIAPLMLLVREAVEMPLAPRIVHDWEAGHLKQLQHRLSQAALASTIVTTIIVASIVFASSFILGAFGQEFVANADLLLWIGLAQIINSATGAAPTLLSMVGGMKERVAAQTLTLFVQTGTAILLVPAWGARGAAVSLVAAILTWSIANWALARRTTGLDTSILSLLTGRSGRD
jgi:O-antigen/teichoic acid export membrane protein